MLCSPRSRGPQSVGTTTIILSAAKQKSVLSPRPNSELPNPGTPCQKKRPTPAARRGARNLWERKSLPMSLVCHLCVKVAITDWGGSGGRLYDCCRTLAVVIASHGALRLGGYYSSEVKCLEDHSRARLEDELDG
jgi:hypothetical protein